MPTNEERREVARRLRETGEELGSAALLWYHIAKALGVRTSTDGKTSCGMLADLIEPSERACYYYDAETNHCRCYDTRLVDRDALLALAGDIDKQTDGSIFDIWLEDGHYIARRIREALGRRNED